MEHLLPPDVKAPIRVPFFWPEGDVKDDTEYNTLFSNVLLAQQEPENAPPFQQQAMWWSDYMYIHGGANLWNVITEHFFFGIVFKILNQEVELDVVEDDEGDGFRYLSTRNLTRVLDTWHERVLETDDEEKATRLLVAKVVLSQASIILRHLSRVLYAGCKPETAGRDPGALTHFACVVLHQAMVEACGKVLGLEVRAGNEYSLRSGLPLVYYQMQKENWCPRTLWTFQEMTDIDEWVYAYWLGSAQTSRDHGGCSTTVCLANHMPEDSLPMHVLSGECTDCAIVEVPTLDILTIVKSGSTPLLRVTGTTAADLSLQVTSMESNRKYIAISHVWADGLGSSKSNAIRTCRLLELSLLTTRLEEELEVQDLHVWADTLCIPLDPAYEHVRAVQIQRMNSIYREAFAVVVIDADLIRLNRDASIKEIGMRLELSAWASRLWTYQEGSLNDRILIMTQERYTDLTAILHGGARSQRDLIHSRMAAKMWSSTALILGRVNAGLSLPAQDEYDSEAGNELFDIERNLRQKGDRKAQMLLWAVTDRTTSRSDDEATVIASTLSLDTTLILEAPAEERMMALIKVMPAIPANLIFNIGPRLTFPGFQWAPSTLLRSKGGGCITAPIEELVPMSLDQIEKNHVVDRTMSRLDDVGKGLWTFNPGIRLPGEYFTDTADPNNSLAFEVLGRPMAIQGLADDANDIEAYRRQTERIKSLLLGGKDLVVLLAEFYPSGKHYSGVLVETVDGSPAEKSTFRNDVAVSARFVMIVSFINGPILDSAAKAMGLDGGGEVNYFVAASSYIDEQDRSTRVGGQDNQGQGASKMDDIEMRPTVNTDFDSPHEISKITNRERTLERNQEEERRVADVVRGLKRKDAEKRNKQYQAAWLEPRYWLVD